MGVEYDLEDLADTHVRAQYDYANHHNISVISVAIALVLYKMVIPSST